jgi:plastocyanin
MRDIRPALPIGLAVVALAAVGCGDGNDEGSATAAETATAETSTAGLPKLIGTVGSTDDPDAYEINLTTEDGGEVTTVLPPGEYVLEINDLSTIHNFHLDARRAGVDVATDVAGTGEKTTIVVLQDGEAYIYACDAHPARMNVTFSIHGRIRTQN